MILDTSARPPQHNIVFYLYYSYVVLLCHASLKWDEYSQTYFWKIGTEFHLKILTWKFVLQGMGHCCV